MRGKIGLGAIFLMFLTGLFSAYASESYGIKVFLLKPEGKFKMGDTPSFIGIVKNTGKNTAKGLIVYLSLVSLKGGNEHPVDLEDWSANRAVRIDKLMPGKSNKQRWEMRLIISDILPCITTGDLRNRFRAQSLS
jgi:hypothetical protein